MNIFAPVVDSRDTVPSAAAADNEINGEIETRDRCKGSNATGAGRRNGKACSPLSPHTGGKFNIGILQMPPALLKHATSATAF